MTAPVTQTAALGGFLVQFVLPKDVTLTCAPEPLDARIKLREVPPSRVAIVRYSGFWSESNGRAAYPYPTGTFTPQETSSFARRDNVQPRTVRAPEDAEN